MPICTTCGSDNRAGARFCWNCSTPFLLAPDPVAHPTMIIRPNQEDLRWLAATLSNDDSSNSMPQAAAGRTALLSTPSDGDQEGSMDQLLPTAPMLFGGRYEIIAQDEQGWIEVVDREPWRRCWACGSMANEAGEAFCIECGAALEQRHYQGTLTPADPPTGLALIVTVEDELARTILPEIWDYLDQDGHTLVLLKDSGRGPVALPLDELAALRVGVALAHLLTILHSYGLALGTLAPDDLEVTAAGQPHLRDARGLRRIDDDATGDAIRGDLRALAHLLEALTDTPRTTQRLDASEVLTTISEPDFVTVLRAVRTETIVDTHELLNRLNELLIERIRPLPLIQRVGAASDTGIVREHNEDSLLALDLCMNNSSTGRSWGLYIVADGMGGHAAGEIASGLAIRGAAEIILREYLTPTLDLDADYDEEHVQQMVLRATLQANDYLLRESQSRGNDMGTTLVMVLVVGDRATIANVGDSRIYLYREGKLQRISQDHSLVMRLVELGQISEEDIYTHPQRNAVLRSLGDNVDVEVDLFSERLYPGDALLLCSDGQWEMTRDPEMEHILSQYDDPQQACQRLIEAANQAGGEDNITSVLVKFA